MSVQLMITSTIISHSHAPLQLCSVALYCHSKSQFAVTLMVSITMERHYKVVVVLAAANNYTCNRQLYRLVPVLLHLFSNFI